MRLRALLLLTVFLLSISATARAESETCGPALAVTGEHTYEVFQNCGRPTWVKRYPGTGGRYRRLPVEIWMYDLGEGTFPRVLRFVNGILEEITVVSRERF
jgi:hypothetical protein